MRDTTSPLPALLTVREVADTLRVDPSTAYRYVADGTLPSIRLRADGTIRIPTAELRRLLERTPR
jgi:excisionase family DNA binding protein